jgi:hypothetical protein
LSYGRRVVDQAWADTLGVAGVQSRKRLVFSALGIALLIGVVSQINGALAVFSVLEGLAVSLTVFVWEIVLFFGWHLVMAPRGGRKSRFDHAASPWYSWIRPPSRSVRRTSRGLTAIGASSFASGVARARARWGRPLL